MTAESWQLDPKNPPTFPVATGPGTASLRHHIYRALPEIDRTEAIITRLRNSMSVGLLCPGDRLPTEMEMAESFGVSPTTLRDALATLRRDGLVETRRGRHGGTFVVSLPESSRDMVNRRLAGLSVVELRDIGDFRTAVSTASARLATVRAVKSDLEGLDQLIEVFAAADGAGAYARADSRIWLELAVIAQSRQLLSAELQLQMEICELLWAPSATPRDQDSVLRSLRSLSAALAHQDAAAAVETVSLRIRSDTFHLIDRKLTLVLNENQEDTVSA